MTMVLGSGDSSYVDGPVGYLVGWALAFFGVCHRGRPHRRRGGFRHRLHPREGQGMGASGYIDHIVICGWNPTARESSRNSSDEFKASRHHPRRRVQPGRQRHPFVRGDLTSGDDLGRAGIEDAAAAIICRRTVRTTPTCARSSQCWRRDDRPGSRTVVEVGNPKTSSTSSTQADEILVTATASRLLARSALYPGWPPSSPTWCPAVGFRVSGPGARTSSARHPAPWPPAGSDHNSSLIAVTRDGINHAARPPTSCCARVIARSSSPIA